MPRWFGSINIKRFGSRVTARGYLPSLLFLTTLVAVLLLVSLPTAASAQFAGGAGTSSDPFQISNCVELQSMSVDVQEFYILVNDIDCTFDTQNAAGALFNDGAGFDPRGRDAGQNPTSNTFIGIFDGQGFKIIGLKINRPSEHGIGLFGSVGSTPAPPVQVEIKNVRLENVDIIGATHTGSLAGFSRETIFRDVSSSGSVTGTTYTGGLIAEVFNAHGIFDSSSSASVSGGSEVGGLVGRAWDGIINHVVRSFATGNVFGAGNQVGGLIGFNKSVDAIESFATGNVRGVDRVGGLIGSTTENAGTINSYAQGDVIGNGDVGGFVGYSNAFHDGWENSYSSGLVSGSANVGGFIGSYQAGGLIANFWDQTKNLSLQDTGSGGDKAGISAETTANMFTVATYTAAGWDFSVSGPWNPINDGFDYPRLNFPTINSDRLVFDVQPSNTIADAAISPAVKVSIQDASGKTDATFSGNITMDIDTNPSGGTLSGTTTVSAVNGIATFTNLRIAKAGNSYTLSASATSLDSEISNPFDIVDLATACTLVVTPTYDEGILTIDVVLRTRVATTANVWGTSQSTIVQILSEQPLPVIDPPMSRTITKSVPAKGIVGLLATLTTPENNVICLDSATVDTGLAP